jgi:N utilization substance protein A
MVIELFKVEVPEISEGLVEIKACAREPGSRAKIAVVSHDHDVDPVGACVGMRGSRVQNVVSELRGEKIDIIPWTPDIGRFACSAIAPAEVARVYVDSEAKELEIIVPDDQLSLAIGKKGQNVRLAARLIGWKIDIKSETRAAEAAEAAEAQELDPAEAEMEAESEFTVDARPELDAPQSEEGEPAAAEQDEEAAPVAEGEEPPEGDDQPQEDAEKP